MSFDASSLTESIPGRDSAPNPSAISATVLAHQEKMRYLKQYEASFCPSTQECFISEKGLSREAWKKKVFSDEFCLLWLTIIIK